VCINCDTCQAFPQGKKHGQKQPDFVILHHRQAPNTALWFVVDMKGKSPDVSSAIKQLQHGSDLIASHKKFALTHPPLELIPLIVHSGVRHVEDFARRIVKFRGSDCPVQHVKADRPVPLASYLR